MGSTSSKPRKASPLPAPVTNAAEQYDEVKPNILLELKFTSAFNEKLQDILDKHIYWMPVSEDGSPIVPQQSRDIYYNNMQELDANIGPNDAGVPLSSTASSENKVMPQMFMPTMHEVPDKRGVGEIFNDLDTEVFTWKISHVSSSLFFTVDNFVQSPPFSFGGAFWILKLFPYGQTKYLTEGCTDVVIERVHSEIEQHHLHVTIYCVSVFVEQELRKSSSILNSTRNEVTELRIMPNLKDTSENPLLAPNGTLMLVFEFENSSTMQLCLEPVEKAASNSYAVSKCAQWLEIGEFHKESLYFKTFTWNVWDVPNYLLQSNFLESPQFSFANATWILMIDQFDQNVPPTLRMALKRLSSGNADHYVKIKVCLQSPDIVAAKSLIFNKDITEGNIHFFQFPLSLNNEITFQIEIKNDRFDFDSRTKIVRSVDKQASRCPPQNLNHVSTETAQNSQSRMKAKPVPQNSTVSTTGNQSPQDFLLVDNTQPKVKTEDDALISNPPTETGALPNNPTIVKDWRQSLTQDFRNELVQKIVHIIFPTPDKTLLQDRNMIRLLAFAQVAENRIYTIANSREQYYQLLAEKIYIMQKEIKEKMQKKLELEKQQQQVDSSNLAAELGNNAVEESPGGTCTSSIILSEEKASHDFRELFPNKEDSDVLFKVKGEAFPAHKFILKARSPIFAAAFLNDTKKGNYVVTIENCDPSCFSDFLHFLYCGDVNNFSEKNVFSLFAIAQKYEILDLKAKCIEFMRKNLSVDTFYKIISFALLHFVTELVDLTADFFIKNAPKIIVNDQWGLFLAEHPAHSNKLLAKLLALDEDVSI